MRGHVHVCEIAYAVCVCMHVCEHVHVTRVCLCVYACVSSK